MEQEPKKISESSIKETDWAPAITLRPHHAFHPSVRDALNEKRDIFKPVNSLDFKHLLRKLRYFPDVLWYSNDVSGFGEYEKYARQNLNTNMFLEQLKALPDEAIVHLDLARDDICNACVIGKHCLATEDRFLGRIRNASLIETSRITKVHELLIAKGFQEETDFKFQETKPELLNYHGKKVWQEDNPTPELIDFQSMLVKMKALRAISPKLK